MFITFRTDRQTNRQSDRQTDSTVFRVAPTMSKNNLFQIVNLRISIIFDKIPNFSKYSQEKSFKMPVKINFLLHIYTLFLGWAG